MLFNAVSAYYSILAIPFVYCCLSFHQEFNHDLLNPTTFLQILLNQKYYASVRSESNDTLDTESDFNLVSTFDITFNI